MSPLKPQIFACKTEPTCSGQQQQLRSAVTHSVKGKTGRDTGSLVELLSKERPEMEKKNT